MSTTEQLRADIDTGRTRDKVDFPDPAAAPLGTDAEAGGTPASPQTVAADRRAGLERPRAGGQQGRPPALPWLVGLVVAAVVAGLAVLFVS